MAAPTPDLLRVSVVGGRRRIDLAVPGAVPLAELLPELARGVGMLDAAGAYVGHRLLTADGRTLSTGAGLAGQGVPDGSLLTLVAGAVPPPPRMYDDPADAVCAAVDTLPAWPTAARRWLGLTVAAALSILGALAALSARTAPLPVLMSVSFCAAAAVLSRRRAGTASAAVVAWLAAAYAGVAGAVLAPPGPALTSPLAAGGAGAVLAGLSCVIGFERGRVLALPPVLLGCLALAVGLAGTRLGAAHVGVLLLGVLVVVVLVAGAMPWLAVGVVRIDDDAADVRLAHELLVALAVAVGGLLVLAAPLAVGCGLPGVLLIADCAVVVMLRARHCRSAPERLAAELSGTLALAVLAAVGLTARPTWHLGEAVVLALAGAGVLLAVLLGEGSVRRAHAADLAESLATVALLPLLVVVVGVPGWAAGLVG